MHGKGTGSSRQNSGKTTMSIILDRYLLYILKQYNSAYFVNTTMAMQVAPHKIIGPSHIGGFR